MWDKIKDWFEDTLDSLIGKSGRKFLEQVGHFAIWPGGIGGVPGAAAVLGLNYIPGVEIPIWGFIIGGLITSTAATLWREYNQNIGDEPDDRTLTVLPIGPGLPVNWDMIIDICVSIPGGLIAGIGFSFI